MVKIPKCWLLHHVVWWCTKVAQCITAYPITWKQFSKHLWNYWWNSDLCFCFQVSNIILMRLISVHYWNCHELAKWNENRSKTLESVSVILLLSSFPEHSCQEDITSIGIQEKHSKAFGVCAWGKKCVKLKKKKLLKWPKEFGENFVSLSLFQYKRSHF